HTRFSRDWSSDVCSSDLNSQAPLSGVLGIMPAGRGARNCRVSSGLKSPETICCFRAWPSQGGDARTLLGELDQRLFGLGQLGAFLLDHRRRGLVDEAGVAHLAADALHLALQATDFLVQARQLGLLVD